MDSRQPRRLRPRIGAARPVGRGEAAHWDRRAPPRGDPGVRGGAGAAQRGVREIGAAKKSNEEAACPKAHGRGREAQGRRSRGSRPRRRRPATSSTRHWPKFPTCRSMKCPTARTRPAMSSITISATGRTTPSRPSSISTWAKRSARWISRPRRSSRARGSWCSRAGLRRWSVRSGSSCSTCTPATMATPKSRRRCWCATR